MSDKVAKKKTDLFVSKSPLPSLIASSSTQTNATSWSSMHPGRLCILTDDRGVHRLVRVLSVPNDSDDENEQSIAVEEVGTHKHFEAPRSRLRRLELLDPPK